MHRSGVLMVLFLMAVLAVLHQVVADPIPPPVFGVPHCSKGQWTAPQYFLTKTEPGQYLTPRDNTTLAMCWTDDGIHVRETAQDKYPLSRSTTCNDAVWEDGAALELFISRVSSPYDVPIHYFELDVTPSLAVFGKIIINNKGNVTTCPTCTSTDVIPCSGINYFHEYPKMTHKVAITPTGWETTRFLPFQLFDKFVAPSRPELKNRLFRFNAYRYDYPDGIDADHKRYELSGVSPTWTAGFHEPSRFALLEMVDLL